MSTICIHAEKCVHEASDCIGCPQRVDERHPWADALAIAICIVLLGLVVWLFCQEFPSWNLRGLEDW